MQIPSDKLQYLFNIELQQFFKLIWTRWEHWRPAVMTRSNQVLCLKTNLFKIKCFKTFEGILHLPKTRPLSKIILPTSNRRRVSFGRTDQAKVGLYWRRLTPKQTEEDWIEIYKHKPIIVPFTDMVKKSFVHIHMPSTTVPEPKLSRQ